MFPPFLSTFQPLSLALLHPSSFQKFLLRRMSSSPLHCTLAARMKNIISDQKLAAGALLRTPSQQSRDRQGASAASKAATRVSRIVEPIEPSQACESPAPERCPSAPAEDVTGRARHSVRAAGPSDRAPGANSTHDPNQLAILPNEPKPPPEPPSLTVVALLRAPSSQSRDRQGASAASKAATRVSRIVEPVVPPQACESPAPERCPSAPAEDVTGRARHSVRAAGPSDRGPGANSTHDPNQLAILPNEPNPPPEPSSLTVGALLRTPSQQSRDRQGATGAFVATTRVSRIVEPIVPPQACESPAIEPPLSLVAEFP
jgi:hypothetical protein